MGDSTKRLWAWLVSKKDEIFLQAALIPLMTWLLSWIAKQFVEAGMIRDIGFYVIVLGVMATGCFLLVWFDRRKNVANAPRLDNLGNYILGTP